MKKRRLRYIPEEDALLEITLPVEGARRKNRVIGLVRDESFTGCCAVFRKPFPCLAGQSIRFSLGSLTDQTGEIKWVRDFDEVFVKIGITID